MFEILELVEKTLPTKKYREWYAALMDYGTYLKKQYGNLGTKSSAYQKQSGFKGSDREIRGRILRLLSAKSYTKQQLSKNIDADTQRVTKQLENLLAERLVYKRDSRYHLPD